MVAFAPFPSLRPVVHGNRVQVNARHLHTAKDPPHTEEASRQSTILSLPSTLTHMSRSPRVFSPYSTCRSLSRVKIARILPPEYCPNFGPQIRCWIKECSWKTGPLVCKEWRTLGGNCCDGWSPSERSHPHPVSCVCVSCDPPSVPSIACDRLISDDVSCWTLVSCLLFSLSFVCAAGSGGEETSPKDGSSLFHGLPRLYASSGSPDRRIGGENPGSMSSMPFPGMGSHGWPPVFPPGFNPFMYLPFPPSFFNPMDQLTAMRPPADTSLSVGSGGGRRSTSPVSPVSSPASSTIKPDV